MKQKVVFGIGIIVLFLASFTINAANVGDDDFGDDVFHEEKTEPPKAVLPAEPKPVVATAGIFGPPGPAPLPPPLPTLPKPEDPGVITAGVRSVHGTNYASFNEKCALDSESGTRCNPAAGLTCDMRICKCKNGTLEPDLIFAYSSIGRKCYRVARLQDSWRCEYDIQCTASQRGNYSKCNSITNQCECDDTENLGREVLRLGEVCYVKKIVGSQCQTDTECQATIKGPAVCLGLKQAGTFGVCSCAGGYSYDQLLQECLLVAPSEGSPCISDRQCDTETGLGELSRCNPSTGTCECWDAPHNGQHHTGFYKLTKKCYYRRKQDEDCQVREECAIGYHRMADCLPHPAYNDGKVCQCPPNETCKGGAGSVQFSVVSTLCMVLCAVLIRSF